MRFSLTDFFLLLNAHNAQKQKLLYQTTQRKGCEFCPQNFRNETRWLCKSKQKLEGEIPTTVGPYASVFAFWRK